MRIFFPVLLLLFVGGCSQKVAPPAVQTFQVSTTSLAPGKYAVSFTGTLTIAPYGAPEPPPDTINPPPVVAPPDTAGFVVGCNTFPWVPITKYSAIGMKSLRLYCPWHWIASPDGLYIEPMRQAWTQECPGIDTYLQKAKTEGVDVLLCINQTPEWLRPTGNGTGGNDFPPIPEGRDRAKPESYREYAEVLFQITARYGRKSHPESALKVDTEQQYPNQPQNQKKSGMGLLRMIQIGNEWDHWFSGFNSPKYMQPEEQAAMISACYDAIMRADPSMIVVMGGLTDLNLWYLKRMDAWFAANRPDRKWPGVEIDCHHYSNLLNSPGTDKPTWKESGACMPSEDKAFSQAGEIDAWAAARGRKVFVTEFGADTKKPSMMHIDGARYGKPDEVAQAQLIVESLAEYKRLGVDAAFIYTGPDEDTGADGGQFETCGIMSSKATGYIPKPAYQAVKTYIASLVKK